MTLLEKLHAVYKAIEFIEKSGHNEAQGYDYTRAVDMIKAARQALIDNRVWAEVDFDFVGEPFTIARAKNINAPLSAVRVKCKATFMDLDSTDTKKAAGLGAAADSGDKAVYKAQTGALKYAIRNAFLIPDEGMDPEADERVDRETAPRPKSAPAEIPQYTDWRGTEAATPPTGYETEQIPSEPALREPGDDTESVAADMAVPPTLDELKAFKTRYSKLREDLADANKGALRNYEGLKVDKKVLNFLISVTGQTDPQKITKGQWLDFFERVDKCVALPTGWKGLAAVVDKANGIEPAKQ